MSIFHDEDSNKDDMIMDISNRHCPDSVRQSAYRELERRGVSRHEAQQEADREYGDFWG